MRDRRKGIDVCHYEISVVLSSSISGSFLRTTSILVCEGFRNSLTRFVDARGIERNRPRRQEARDIGEMQMLQAIASSREFVASRQTGNKSRTCEMTSGNNIFRHRFTFASYSSIFLRKAATINNFIARILLDVHTLISRVPHTCQG